MKPEQIRDQGAPLVHRLLGGLVRAACWCPKTVLVTSLVLCALSVYAAITRLEYRTQRSDLVDPHKDVQERWRRYLAEFGDDDDIVVVVKGSERARMKTALDAL